MREVIRENAFKGCGEEVGTDKGDAEFCTGNLVRVVVFFVNNEKLRRLMAPAWLKGRLRLIGRTTPSTALTNKDIVIYI